MGATRIYRLNGIWYMFTYFLVSYSILNHHLNRRSQQKTNVCQQFLEAVHQQCLEVEVDELESLVVGGSTEFENSKN